jgi:hypothetical protein
MTMIEHLSEETILRLKNGSLSEDRKLAALDHIGECDFCADAYAKCLEEDGVLMVSPDFSSEIVKKISRIKKVSNIDGKRKELGKREFYFYSFKVGIAACIALLLLLTANIRYGSGFDLHKTELINLSGVNTITESLRGISDKFVDLDESNRLIGGI